VLPTFCELDARSDDEVLDGRRDQHLARTGEGRHPGTDVDGHPGDIVSSDFDFTCVDTGTLSNLPVVDGGKPVGMVSLADLALERDHDSAVTDIGAAPGYT
jgi:hypothetical protein